MTTQTGFVRASDRTRALGPTIALGILGLSIWLVSVNDNVLLLLPPLGIAVLSAKRVRANRWYLLPLVPCAAFVLWMALAMIAMWTARA